MDWSYDLLSGQERLLFDRLSVFAGGWTLEAAEVVCSDDGEERETGGQGPANLLRSEDVLDLLGHLLEKSMVVGERFADGLPRYRMLETLRQYGQEQLSLQSQAATDTLCARHANHFVALGEQAARGMRGPDQAKWLDHLECEHDNMRAGLEWAKAANAPADRVELGLRLAATLWRYWYRRGYGREGCQRFATLLTHPNAQQPSRARAQALLGAGSLALWQANDEATAWKLLDESLSMAGQLRDTRVMADALHNLGVVSYNRGDHASARRQHNEALRLARADGDMNGIRWALEDLADLAADEDDTKHAAELYEEALSLARQTGDLHSIASILQSIANLALATGNAGRASELLKEGLSIMQPLGGEPSTARCLANLAFVTSAAAPERSVRLLGAVDAIQERAGFIAPTISVNTVEKTLTEARRHLGEAAYAAAWSEGRAMNSRQATAYALGPCPAALST